MNASGKQRPVLPWILLCAVVGYLLYLASMRFSAHQVAADDLSWMRREFHLTENQTEHIRQLHQGYLPKCEEMCARIAKVQAELEETLKQGETPDAKLMEIAALRAQCQAAMLRHFKEVSQAMDTEQGKRYLSEMQSLTLGLHEDLERRMGEKSSSAPQHGHH